MPVGAPLLGACRALGRKLLLSHSQPWVHPAGPTKLLLVPGDPPHLSLRESPPTLLVALRDLEVLLQETGRAHTENTENLLVCGHNSRSQSIISSMLLQWPETSICMHIDGNAGGRCC